MAARRRSCPATRRSPSSSSAPTRSPGGASATRATSSAPATRCCSRSPIRRSARASATTRPSRQDPWGRLMRTTDYLYLLVYGGRAAGPMGRRLRELHKSIKGMNPDGTRYHALEPEAYAWVHATLIEAAFVAGRALRRRHHARPTASASTPSTCRSGGWSACAPATCPRPCAEFRDYVDTMIDDRLVRHETVDAADRPARPPGAAGPAGDRPALAAAAGRALPGAEDRDARAAAAAPARALRGRLDRAPAGRVAGARGGIAGADAGDPGAACATSAPSTCAGAARRSRRGPLGYDPDRLATAA